MLGESNRGQQSQSMLAEGPTSARVSISPITPYSPMEVAWVSGLSIKMFYPVSGFRVCSGVLMGLLLPLPRKVVYHSHATRRTIDERPPGRST